MMKRKKKNKKDYKQIARYVSDDSGRFWVRWSPQGLSCNVYDLERSVPDPDRAVELVKGKSPVVVLERRRNGSLQPWTHSQIKLRLERLIDGRVLSPRQGG